MPSGRRSRTMHLSMVSRPASWSIASSSKLEASRASRVRWRFSPPVCSSCDEGDGHKRDPMLHCGLCTSCLFRRVAITATGRVDPTCYRDLPSKLRHNSYELAAFEHHANVLSRVAAFEDLTDADPNVRHVFKAPIGADLALDVARSQTVEMYHRYAAEIRRFLTVSRPTLRPRTPRPAKEVVRDLFAATR